ncbi:MAG: AAA family ATPase [Solirubrobacteraceae bacterium]
MCIDEYQHVPAVLDAIKAQLNRELRPGRYVITGSTRYDALPIAAQSLTGRLHLLTVWPLTQGEIDGARENLLAALLERNDGGVFAFEVKAAGQVAGRDMRHLRKLRDALGERFLTGVALYTGARAYNFEDRLHVMPIDRIWTPV